MLTIIGTSDQIKRHKNVNLLRKVVFLNLVFIPGGVQIFEHSNFTKSNKTVLVMIWKWSKRTHPRYLRSVKKTHIKDDRCYTPLYVFHSSSFVSTSNHPITRSPLSFSTQSPDTTPASPATCKTLHRHVPTACSNVSPFSL